MNCPNCQRKFRKLAALNLAKSRRVDGYICPDCNAILRDKKLPGSFKIRSTILLLFGFVLAIPADAIWRFNIYAGGAYFLAVAAGLFLLFYHWAVPSDYRSCPLELARE